MKNATALIAEHEAAQYLGLAVQTLRQWRFKGKGPGYVKMGRAVRYDPTELQSFIDSRRVVHM